MHLDPPLTRRAVLLGGLGALATGCSDAGDPTVATPTSGPTGQPTTAVPTPTSPATTGPAPASPAPAVPAAFTAPAGEVQPALKQVAGRFVQRLATFGPSGPEGRLPTGAAALVVPGVLSRAQVQFVQLGGLRPVGRPTYASAMVVLEQVLTGPRGGEQVLTRTVDVRLRRRSGTWVVDALGSVGEVSTATRGPSAAATAVLASSRLQLPGSARFDVAAGAISPTLLAALLDLSQATPLTVTVLRSGHPRNVIDDRGSGPVSAHTRGRAVDVWALGGTPVRELGASRVRSFGRRALDLTGVVQVGVPEGLDLDGGGRRSFANAVHNDHVHIAVA